MGQGCSGCESASMTKGCIVPACIARQGRQPTGNLVRERLIGGLSACKRSPPHPEEGPIKISGPRESPCEP